MTFNPQIRQRTEIRPARTHETSELDFERAKLQAQEVTYVEYDTPPPPRDLKTSARRFGNVDSYLDELRTHYYFSV